MGWAKFDDQFTDHPKVVAAGPWAELLAMRAIIHCARHETDGHVQAAQLPRLALGITSAKKQVAALVRAGLWREDPDGDGWWVHDFLDYHPTREQKAADREIAKRRYAMNNNPDLAKTIKARDDNRCRYCGIKVNWRDRKSPAGGTYDHVVPVSQGGDESVDNLVVCCRACNTKKGPRSPEEAGMELRSPPETSSTTARSDAGSSGHPDPAPPAVPDGTGLPPQPPAASPQGEPVDNVVNLNPRAAGTNPRAQAAAAAAEQSADRKAASAREFGRTVAAAVGTDEDEALEAIRAQYREDQADLAEVARLGWLEATGGGR